MTVFSTKSKIFKITAAITSLIFWVGLWHFASLKIGDSFFLPSPLEVAKQLLELMKLSEVQSAVLATFVRVISGYALGLVLGCALALLTHKIVIVKALFAPLISVIRATPVVSVIIVAFLLLARQDVPSYIVMLMVLPIVWGNIEEGLSSVDKSLIEMADMYGFGFFKKLTKLYLPAVMPYLSAAAITAFGLAWKSGVAAEVICYPENSLGRLIYKARQDLYSSAGVFALTALVVMISIILEIWLKKLLKSSRKVRK